MGRGELSVGEYRRLCRLAPVVCCALLAGLVLGACGGSSIHSSTTTSTAATAVTGGGASTATTRTSPTGRVTGSNGAAGAAGRSAGATHSPGAAQFKQVVAKFAVCMREHGMSYPTPGTGATPAANPWRRRAPRSGGREQVQLRPACRSAEGRLRRLGRGQGQSPDGRVGQSFPRDHAGV